MDDEPFVFIDLREVAQDSISDNALDAFLKLRKDTFDPADVGADAQRKLHIAAYLDVLERVFKQPPEIFVKALMDLAGIEGRRTARLVEEHTPILTEAINTFFDKKLLERVGFADRQDLVRVPEAPIAYESSDKEGDSSDFKDKETLAEPSGIITTETELRVFDYVKSRLPFLMERDESLYQNLNHVFSRDYKTVFNVSYKQERKGRLFSFKEGADPKYRFEFPGSGTEIDTNNLYDIDEELLAAFLKRVEELG